MLPHHSEIESRIRQLAGPGALFVLTDSNVGPLTADFLPDAPRLTVEAGEGSKTLAGAERVWRFLVEGGAMRNSLLVNVGGGMVTDLGGFAASTYMRGIGCVNVPTTLLAAVDAAIGGKTGINFAGLKNEVGSFALPLGVFPLTRLFATLPEEEWLSGVGEAIKTGLLCSEELYRLATSEAFIVRREPEVTERVVAACAAFKQRIVEQDLREKGIRRILNLGHTYGHAIEEWHLAHGRGIPHGVAVAHGLAFALEASQREAGLDPEVTANYREILAKYFPSLGMSDAELKEAWKYMQRDKKNVTPGRVERVLLRAVGDAF